MQQPHRHTRRSWLRIAGGSAAALALPAAVAQTDFPRGPLRILVPLPAGGAVDTSVRATAVELERLLKQTVVVDNRPGGVFQIGMQALLSAPADGHTLIHLNSGMAAAQVVQKRYDLTRQLAPVSLSGESQMVILVNPKSPYKTLRDLLDAARANPGKLTYSMPGAGTGEHLKVAQIEKDAGVTLLAVPYKGGPDMVKAVIGGEVDFTVTAAIFAAQFAPKGLVRVAATLDPARLKDFPDAPTLAETGLKVAPLRFWGGFAVHADTPPALVQRLHEVLTAATLAPALIERLAPFGMVLQPSASPEDFRKFIGNELVWMAEAAKGLKLEAS